MATECHSDNELLERIKEGDQVAFATLVTKHSHKYYNLAYRYMAQQEDAEDIVQTAFIKLWSNPYMWNNSKNTNFTTWFYRIVVNLCLDYKKKQKPINNDSYNEIEDNKPNQEKIAVNSSNNKMLSTAIKQLPERQKTAFLLCFYQELSHKEAAEVMKINVKALQSLLMRAKTNLKSKVSNLQ